MGHQLLISQATVVQRLGYFIQCIANVYVLVFSYICLECGYSWLHGKYSSLGKDKNSRMVTYRTDNGIQLLNWDQINMNIKTHLQSSIRSP